jgi:hypothetical protein
VMKPWRLLRKLAEELAMLAQGGVRHRWMTHEEEVGMEMRLAYSMARHNDPAGISDSTEIEASRSSSEAQLNMDEKDSAQRRNRGSSRRCLVRMWHSGGSSSVSQGAARWWGAHERGCTASNGWLLRVRG